MVRHAHLVTFRKDVEEIRTPGMEHQLAQLCSMPAALRLQHRSSRLRHRTIAARSS